jgi:hypothetical protein
VQKYGAVHRPVFHQTKDLNDRDSMGSVGIAITDQLSGRGNSNQPRKNNSNYPPNKLGALKKVPPREVLNGPYHDDNPYLQSQPDIKNSRAIELSNTMNSAQGLVKHSEDSKNLK